MRPVLALGLCATIMLPACGQSEAAFREEYRSTNVPACAAAARGRVGAATPTGFDFDRVCTCAIDRYMEGKTVAELRSEQERDVAPPEAQEALRQCVAEEMANATGMTE